MKKIETIGELNALRTSLENEKAVSESKNVTVKVAMSTCSIATGSEKVMEYFQEQMKLEAIGSKIIKTGCMGLCHSEPTVEITVPGKEPVIFGKVDQKRVKIIIQDYIKLGKEVDGVIS